jgi:hypothetical protein
MPTVVREDGFRVPLFGPPREQPPIHVHVERGREELVVVRLKSRTKPQEVWAVYGMKNSDVLRAFRLVDKYEEDIRAAWRTLHG